MPRTAKKSPQERPAPIMHIPREGEVVPAERVTALWAVLDGCQRLDGGVVLLEEADQQRFIETAATIWAITQECAGRVIRGYLTIYVVGCPWRLLSPAQHGHLAAALQQHEVWSRRPGEYEVPEAAAPETCASCGAEIVWAMTEAERAIPLSLATVERRGGRRLALTHFADCPQGAGWSRRGGRETHQEAAGGR